MSTEFAAAMVTVIPVTLLLGGVEINTLQARRRQEAETIQGLIEAAADRILARLAASESPDQRDLSIVSRKGRHDFHEYTVLQMMWGIYTVAGILAEMYLVMWLALAEGPKTPWAANAVAWIGVYGFFLVLFSSATLLMSQRQYQSEVVACSPLPTSEHPAVAAAVALGAGTNVVPPQPDRQASS
ncbi:MULTISPECIES: hypothetical protein [Streptomyces]|uniref:Integral membrane protein n=1 Tax=Streptomyces solicathayae TaxID=3081768 RepID=A0ABZ0LKW8_9ACTN|nr:hypothetical protein [Streptomyces sp. HUAS YS2]WOX19925.1 hypothetical protein R2D22_00295 [Streptomyces sp. HUAS YS2]